MIGTICHQLLVGADCKMLKEAGFEPNYVEHGLGIYPQDSTGNPFNASAIQSKGDVIVDLSEDMAAEQKARKTYEYLIDLIDDPDVIDPLRFLRAREIVHFQRFGEALTKIQEMQASKKFY